METIIFISLGIVLVFVIFGATAILIYGLIESFKKKDNFSFIMLLVLLIFALIPLIVVAVCLLIFIH